jgi:alpha-glucosidase
MGTLCHQLAQYVVFETPIQMCVDYPARYRGSVGLEFLEQVPTTWDRTIVIEGRPGQHIAMARKNGDSWYIGCMNAGDARKLSLELDFLGKGTWRIDAFADGRRADNVPEQIRRSRGTVRATDTLSIRLARDGGYAARLTPD